MSSVFDPVQHDVMPVVVDDGLRRSFVGRLDERSPSSDRRRSKREKNHRDSDFHLDSLSYAHAGLHHRPNVRLHQLSIYESVDLVVSLALHDHLRWNSSPVAHADFDEIVVAKSSDQTRTSRTNERKPTEERFARYSNSRHVICPNSSFYSLEFALDDRQSLHRGDAHSAETKRTGSDRIVRPVSVRDGHLFVSVVDILHEYVIFQIIPSGILLLVLLLFLAIPSAHLADLNDQHHTPSAAFQHVDCSVGPRRWFSSQSFNKRNGSTEDDNCQKRSRGRVKVLHGIQRDWLRSARMV